MDVVTQTLETEESSARERVDRRRARLLDAEIELSQAEHDLEQIQREIADYDRAGRVPQRASVQRALAEARIAVTSSVAPGLMLRRGAA